MNILQALVDFNFWKEMGADLFDDTIGYAVLCVACVLMLSYLREVPPKFEKKRILGSGVILCFGAFFSRSIAHFCGNVLEKPDVHKTIFISSPNILPESDLLDGIDKVSFDNIFKCALNNIIFKGFDFGEHEYQKYVLIVNVIVTFISLTCICAGAFILMETFKAKHIIPMAIVQIAGFLLKEVSETPYFSMINKVFFDNSLKETEKYGYNGFAYGCFMIIMIISYIFITRKKYEIFWTKRINVGKHVLSIVGLFVFYSLLIVFSNKYNGQDEDVFIKWIILVFLAVVLLFVPWRTYSITRAELQNDFYEVKREEKVELYEYSHAQSTAIRKYIHDLPNHFRMIDEMAAKINADEISEYVHGLDKELVEAKCEFSTGNAYLDDLLVTELKIAKKFDANIIFTGVFPNEGIKKKDITTVFMNLIDNAIEACKKVSDKREISINSKIVDNRVYVSISNPFEHTHKKSNEIFKTTKKDNGFHGFGMSNVKNTVERKGYDGNFSTEEKNNIFTASIDMKFKL